MAQETIQSAVFPPPAPAVAEPAVRRIGLSDLGAALSAGYADFRASPTHLAFLGLIYPVMGLVLGRLASGSNAMPLIYPLISGFALLGPFAAVGLYAMSRQREQGLPVSWLNAFDIFKSPRLGAILMLGVILGGIFVAWLFAAQAVFNMTMRGSGVATLPQLVGAAFSTAEGWRLILLGTAVGFGFAVVSLTIGVMSFPLLVDRDLAPTAMEQVTVAVRTSIRAVLANPVPIGAWGMIVALLLAAGSLPLLVGLAVVVPVLGHATWHLYRKLIV